MKTNITILIAALVASFTLFPADGIAQGVAPSGAWVSAREAVAQPVNTTVRLRCGPIRLEGENIGTVDGVKALVDAAALTREQALQRLRRSSSARQFYGRFTATVKARPNGERYLHIHRSASTATD